MYKHAIAAFAATSGLLLAAGPAAAEEGAVDTVLCGDNNVVSYNAQSTWAHNFEAQTQAVFDDSTLGPPWSGSFVDGRTWFNRTTTCSQSVPSYKAGGVAGLLDGLLNPAPAAQPCTTASTSPSSLLANLGLTQVVDSLWLGAVPCATTTTWSPATWSSATWSPTTWSPTTGTWMIESPGDLTVEQPVTLLDTSGVTSLVNQILGN
ncbi:hypothetical protein [Nonomuraea angiospora]|uniref:hypothetical protein n=1 Tax=Nonomuraea angiospora TaxID=46172 RepID=UPI0029A889EE|nr:hypothetical protein [Nonomuraea angiospora]MDX3108479.1 hypothetical protein [Nonomuraea angiospora]